MLATLSMLSKPESQQFLLTFACQIRSLSIEE